MGLLQVAGEKYSHVNRCLRHDRNKGPMFARYNMLPVHYGVRFLFFFSSSLFLVKHTVYIRTRHVDGYIE